MLDNFTSLHHFQNSKKLGVLKSLKNYRNITMKKLSKDILKSFDQNIFSILSQKRMQSYDGKIEKYYENRILALQAGHKIAELEIYLRNKLDFCLKRLEGEDWIKSNRSLKFITAKNHIPLQELSSSQILSSLMLGEVVELIGEYKMEHYMLDLHHLDFKKYHWNNRNYGYINGRKNHFSSVSKVEISLNLIRSIRNRCFHWENLLKVTIKEDGRIYPRITTIYPKHQNKTNQTRIGISPEMILEFLDDLIACIDNQVIKQHQNIEMKYREI